MIPLPMLFYTEGSLRNESDAHDVFAVGGVIVYGDCKLNGFTEEEIAAAVVHATNAYPKLIEQLRAAAVILGRVEHQCAEHRADIASRAGDVREDCVGLLQELKEKP